MYQALAQQGHAARLLMVVAHATRRRQLIAWRCTPSLLPNSQSLTARQQHVRSCGSTTPSTTAAAAAQDDHRSHPPPPAKWFVFRHFRLQHGGACAMRMGTDAMLLGAWAQPPPHTRAVLDVGTGSGVLALMLAQKTHHHQQEQQQQQQAVVVHAIDIDAASVAQAASNAAASPWAPSLSVHQSSLQDWAAQPQHNSLYDIIISNPPYFLRSSKPGQAHRAAARHADVTLPFCQLARCARQLLAPAGWLCVVLPVQEGRVFTAEAAAAGLQLTRLTEVFMKSSDTQPKRLLMQFEALPADGDTAADATTCRATLDEPHTIPSAAVDPERLVVIVPNPAAAATSTSTSTTTSSSSSSDRQPPPAAAAAAAPWVFSEQYRQLTVDFHHPDLLT